MQSEQEKREVRKRWNNANIKAITLHFTPAQMDVYEHIKAQPSQAEYIRQLVREDMKK